jgi:hypothetical protein
MLTKAEILGAADLKVTRVEVKEWKGHVYVRALTVEDRLELEALGEGAKASDVLATIVACALCDEAGARLFTTPEDIAALTKKNAGVLLALSAKVRKLNAMSMADVEEIAKNSDAARSDVTDSTSPSD